MQENTMSPDEKAIMPEQAVEMRKYQESNNKKDLLIMSCGELIDYLAELLAGDELPTRKEIDVVKSLFYKKATLLEEEEKKSLELNEIRLGDLLSTFKERDKVRVEALEIEMQKNKEAKESLIAEFKELFKSQDDFGKIFTKFKEIREKWDSIGILEAKVAVTLQAEYNKLREDFYDLKHLNDEYRDIDFRKNLEEKKRLLNDMEGLTQMTDVVKALKTLQLLQSEWNTTGPIAKEYRDEIRTRFKELSTTIYKKHQDFFDNKKREEQVNAEKKSEICKEIEQLAAKERNSILDWGNDTKEVLRLQKEWKEIGPTNKKETEPLFANYRRACDAFFMKKTDFFAQRKEEINVAYERKKEIIEKAKALENSEAWVETSNKLKQLQKDWQKIKGVSPTKQNETLWKEFRGYCDTFFSRMKEALANEYQEQEKNLEVKEGIITRLTELKEKELSDKVKKEVNELRNKWFETGHVPFKKKGIINKQFSELLKYFGDIVKENKAQRRLEGYEESIKNLSNNNDIYRERDRMRKILERMKQEAANYAHNMSIFNISDKNSPILKTIQKKKDKLDEDIRLMEEKIKLLINKLD